MFRVIRVIRLIGLGFRVRVIRVRVIRVRVIRVRVIKLGLGLGL